MAGITHHGQIRDRRMATLGGVFIHAVLFHLRFRVFLHPVRRGIGYYADNLDHVFNMFAEIDGVALDLPDAPAIRGKTVLMGIFAFLETTGEGPRFLMGGFGVLRRCPAGGADEQEQLNKSCRRSSDS